MAISNGFPTSVKQISFPTLSTSYNGLTPPSNHAIKLRTDLQKWSSCRNWNKRKLTKAFHELNNFLEFSKRKAIDTNPLYNTKYPLLTESEIEKLNQASKLMEEVRSNYRSSYFEALSKTNFKRK